MITAHDADLIISLKREGLSEAEILSKFASAHECEVIQLLHPSEFHIGSKLFAKRLTKGTIRIGADKDCIEKKCTRCGDWLPLTKEFFHGAKNNPDGAYNNCRACELERRNAQNRKQREAA